VVGLASGTRGTAREVVRVQIGSALIGRPHWAAARERRARGRGLEPIGGVCLSWVAGARSRGLSGPSWAARAEMAFPFSKDFPMPFPFYFL
jgi:hypothetical protein